MGLAQLLAAARGPVGAGGSPGIPNRVYNAGPSILQPGAINDGIDYVKMDVKTVRQTQCGAPRAAMETQH